MSKTHGLSRSGAYSSWQSMKRRCLKVDFTHYSQYGGRGIKVCDAWAESFERFLADMGPRPDGMSLDRIDPNGNYAPDNCRWATKIEQSRNKRVNVLVRIRGEEMCLEEAANLVGITAQAMAYRLKNGLPLDAPRGTRGPKSNI